MLAIRREQVEALDAARRGDRANLPIKQIVQRRTRFLVLRDKQVALMLPRNANPRTVAADADVNPSVPTAAKISSAVIAASTTSKAIASASASAFRLRAEQVALLAKNVAGNPHNVAS